MMRRAALDFKKIEALRKHMLLTTSDMAELFKVSRMTYYGWVRGKPIRDANAKEVRMMLRKLLYVMVHHNWPPPEVIAASQKQRKERLMAVLNSDQ